MRLPLKRIDPGLYDQTGGDTDPAALDETVNVDFTDD